MDNIIKTTLLGLVFGTLGTTLGGIIGAVIKNKSNKMLSFILEFSAGLMISIVCFDLVPEASRISRLPTIILGMLLGIVLMIICDEIVRKKNSFREKNKSCENALLKTGIVIGIGLALHNFPEGLAIGSGFGASIKLGISLGIAIAIHDIPEGISMSVPMRAGGMKKEKVILFTFLSSLTTGMGAFIGIIFSNISSELIGLCLSIAAGAMIYIVSGEILPESKELYKGRTNTIGNILGFIIGIIATRI